MTILQTLDRAGADRSAVGEFHKFARMLTRARGEPGRALTDAEASNAKPRVISILKSAISGGTLTDWSAIADYQQISTAFSESLRSLSVFDSALPFFTPAPLRSRGITVTIGITGANPGEHMIKPISSVVLGSKLVEPRKACAIIVTTEEVLKLSNPNANALFDQELRNAVAVSTDTIFLSDLVAGTTPTASAGATLANIMTDMAALLAAVYTHAGSQLFYVTGPSNMKSLALKASTSGGLVFPGLGPNGGTLLPGVTAIASYQVPANTALLFDASGIAGGADVITLDASRQAIVQMETAPDSPPVAATAMLSLWQTNHYALRSERFFGFTALRSNAVSSLSGVNY
jgi:hypothetical protein